jgi:hypothetical protein
MSQADRRFGCVDVLGWFWARSLGYASCATVIAYLCRVGSRRRLDFVIGGAIADAEEELPWW